jgi:hypothetical protein
MPDDVSESGHKTSGALLSPFAVGSFSFWDLLKAGFDDVWGECQVPSALRYNRSISLFYRDFSTSMTSEMASAMDEIFAFSRRLSGARGWPP